MLPSADNAQIGKKIMHVNKLCVEMDKAAVQQEILHACAYSTSPINYF